MIASRTVSRLTPSREGQLPLRRQRFAGGEHAEADGLQQPSDRVLEGVPGPHRAQQSLARQGYVRVGSHDSYSGVTYAELMPPSTRKRRRGDERGVVAGQECDRGGQLLRLGEPAHRHVDQPARRALGVFGEELLQQRRVHRSGAQRVDADALRAYCTPSSRDIASTPPLDAV